MFFSNASLQEGSDGNKPGRRSVLGNITEITVRDLPARFQRAEKVDSDDNEN